MLRPQFKRRAGEKELKCSRGTRGGWSGLRQRLQPGAQNLDGCPVDKWDSRETPAEGSATLPLSPREGEAGTAQGPAPDPSLRLLEASLGQWRLPWSLFSLGTSPVAALPLGAGISLGPGSVRLVSPRV